MKEIELQSLLHTTCEQVAKEFSEMDKNDKNFLNAINRLMKTYAAHLVKSSPKAEHEYIINTAIEQSILSTILSQKNRALVLNRFLSELLNNINANVKEEEDRAYIYTLIFSDASSTSISQHAEEVFIHKILESYCGSLHNMYSNMSPLCFDPLLRAEDFPKTFTLFTGFDETTKGKVLAYPLSIPAWFDINNFFVLLDQKSWNEITITPDTKIPVTTTTTDNTFYHHEKIISDPFAKAIFFTPVIRDKNIIGIQYKFFYQGHQLTGFINDRNLVLPQGAIAAYVQANTLTLLTTEISLLIRYRYIHFDSSSYALYSRDFFAQDQQAIQKINTSYRAKPVTLDQIAKDIAYYQRESLAKTETALSMGESSAVAIPASSAPASDIAVQAVSPGKENRITRLAKPVDVAIASGTSAADELVPTSRSGMFSLNHAALSRSTLQLPDLESVINMPATPASSS